MILKEILLKTPWEAVWPELVRCYPWLLEKPGNEQGYKRVFDELQTITPALSDLRLVIKVTHDDEGRKSDPVACDIGQEYPNCGSMTFSPWKIWLGLTIEEETLRELSHAEILADSIYNMTWLGGSAEEVDEFVEDFLERTQPLEEMGEMLAQLTESETDEEKLKHKFDGICDKFGFSDI